MNIDLGYQKPTVVFDLDDTIFPERDFVFSGYNAIAKLLSEKYGLDKSFGFEILSSSFLAGKNPLDTLLSKLNEEITDTDESVESLLEIYRFHQPVLTLPASSATILDYLQREGIKMGLVTDGRSRTQRNKICALGIEKYFEPENILISEERGTDKSSPDSFVHFVHRYPNSSRFIYVGDNPRKDFYFPNLLGWQTICLKDKGSNIHSQETDIDEDFAPQIKIDSLDQLINLI